MGVEIELLRKYVGSSIRICYRSVVKHPFLVGMVFLLISMYRLFPLLFSFLVSASPVIVSTAVLLGTLLSLGQPNIPEIEKESKSERDEIHNSETEVVNRTEIVGRDGNFASEDTIGGKIEVGDESLGEKTLVHDDNRYVEVKTPVDLVDDRVLLTGNLQFVEEHLIEEANSEVGNQGTEVDEPKFVLENHYSQLQQSEDEHIVLEGGDKLREGFADPLNSDSGLLWKRVEEDDYDDDDDDDDDEESDSGSDLAESSSPDASMADIIPMLDELHPLLAEEHEAPQPTHVSHDGTDAASEHSLESSDSSSESNDDHGIENHEDLDVGDEEEDESKHADKEDESSPAITWTEDDQKNLMDLGTSELERNQRLENLIARRRARKAMRMQAEKNLIDLESADLPWNIPPISTARNNPFDISYDSNHNIPGSAPSVLLPRRNPFDLPYDSNEEKPDLAGDTFQQEFITFQPKEPFFRRHESFNVPSVFGASRQERQETKLRPYFVAERVASDGTSFSSFQRQVSDVSDTKVSSVPDTESNDSASDLEIKDHIEDDLSREVELISEHEHDGIREHPELTSEGEHVYEHFSPGNQSSEDDGNVDSVQVVEGNAMLHEDKISVGDVMDRPPALDFPETENVALSSELMSDAIHLKLGDQKSHSSASSLSSSYEVSEQIHDEKEGDEIPTSVSETTYYFVDRVNSLETSDIDITRLVVDESQPKEPVYDSSPRAVTKNLSSSSISTDVQADISERTNSVSGQEIVQKMDTDCPCDDAAEDIGSRNVTDHNVNVLELSFGPSKDHLHKDESFQRTEDQPQSSSSVADVKVNSSDPSPETSYAEDQLLVVLDNELSGDNISTSLPNKTLPETEDSLLDMEASHQLEQGRELEQDQAASSNREAQLPEVVHGGTYENPGPTRHQLLSEETVTSLPDKELPLSDASVDNPSKENPEALQGGELERDQVASSTSEAQLPEAVHVETYEFASPAHDQFISNEEAISQLEKGFTLSDASVDNPPNEIPEALQVQITSENLANLQIQELEDDVSGNTNSTVSAEPDVVEVAGIETKASENSADVSDILPENNDDADNTDDVEDEIKEIDENLLAELDAVGDFSVNDLGSTLNEIKHDPHALELNLETNHSRDEDSYSKDLGSTLNEIKHDPHISEHDLETDRSGDDIHSEDLGSDLNETKHDPHVLEHDLETNRSGDQDIHSKDLGSTLDEMEQIPHVLEHDVETNRSGDQDSHSKDLGLTSNEMEQDPHALEHDIGTNHCGDQDFNSKDLGSTLDKVEQIPHVLEHNLETSRFGDQDSHSKDLESTLNDMKQNPHVLEHDLETNRFGDQDSHSKDLESTLNEMEQIPHVLEHDLETSRSGDQDSHSKDLEWTLNDMIQDPHVSEHDLETTNVCGKPPETDSEDVKKPQNEKEGSHAEVASVSEAELSRTGSVNDAKKT